MSSGQAEGGEKQTVIIQTHNTKNHSDTHPHAGASRDGLDLSQYPDVVDELEGHVHELLVAPPTSTWRLAIRNTLLASNFCWIWSEGRNRLQ